jgi:hypothetical protein
MPLFSQRKGLKPVKSVFQIDSMDDELRNSLWNAFYIFFWKPYNSPEITGTTRATDKYEILIRYLWIYYFKKPLNDVPIIAESAIDVFKRYFFDCKWHEVYDFIEFSQKAYPDVQLSDRFRQYCNVVLEREISAYRFVDNVITQITNESEIAEIEKAIVTISPLQLVNTHISRALELLSDRTAPDYRNSIKESISAVEGICKLITGDNKATLGQALTKIEDKKIVELHTSLKEGFKQLYGFTNDAAGIRHAIKDGTTVSFEDAKFMLVSCSAFVNYLIAQSAKAGITL